MRRMKKKVMKRGEEEKEENQTGRVKRRRDGSSSVEAFEIFSQGRCGELWWSVFGGPLGEA